MLTGDQLMRPLSPPQPGSLKFVLSTSAMSPYHISFEAHLGAIYRWKLMVRSCRSAPVLMRLTAPKPVGLLTLLSPNQGPYGMPPCIHSSWENPPTSRPRRRHRISISDWFPKRLVLSAVSLSGNNGGYETFTIVDRPK